MNKPPPPSYSERFSGREVSADIRQLGYSQLGKLTPHDWDNIEGRWGTCRLCGKRGWTQEDRAGFCGDVSPADLRPTLVLQFPWWFWPAAGAVFVVFGLACVAIIVAMVSR